jgi:signal transduction histidine kinase
MLAGLTILAVAVLVTLWAWPKGEPHFHSSFHSGWDEEGVQSGWQAFGGTWQVVDGAMRNISDDRGAKLMNGSPDWHNYMVQADVQLLGESGDAGFVIRASNEEVGVDSYDGYFAGLRDADETLILGRADYGWHELQTIPIHSGVQAGDWYHLKVMAYECTLIASATTPSGEVRTARLEDDHCLTKGRFGLQSYSTGAVWRNLEVRNASELDMKAMLLPQVLAARSKQASSDDTWTEQRFVEPMQRELRDHQADLHALQIGSLRLLPQNLPSPVTIHGVVTMVSPILFVQDSSGGIAIPNATTSKPVQIGDAVEARGDAEQQDFSSVLHDATVRLLWSHTPVPPVSVTASQAATGAFDSQFVETEGRLASEQRPNGQTLVLKLNEGSQSFVAVAENLALAQTLRDFKTGSRLRLRGICVTDRTFARDGVPFALLMRSAEDAEIVELPPWWSTRHIIEVIFGLATISFALQYGYITIKRNRLRAILEERERVAHEMHDTLAQSFAGIGYQLEALCDELEPGSHMRSQLESTADLVRFGHLEARRNITALRPGNIEREGIAKALDQAAHAMVQGGVIAIKVSVRGEQVQIPLRIADTLFRVGQEAIANAVRHAKPHTIHIGLVYGKASVKLVVRDDGKGFSQLDDSSGFGIRGMERRADAIAASLRLRTSPGHGTSVSVRATLPKSFRYTWWRRSQQNPRPRRPFHGKTV